MGVFDVRVESGIADALLGALHTSYQWFRDSLSRFASHGLGSLGEWARIGHNDRYWGPVNVGPTVDRRSRYSARRARVPKSTRLLGPPSAVVGLPQAEFVFGAPRKVGPGRREAAVDWGEVALEGATNTPRKRVQLQVHESRP